MIDWLPPKKLPATGAKEFKVGQIWACRFDDHLTSASVRKITSVGYDGYSECELLAGEIACFWHKSSIAAHHAILVADVDCEPIDPDLLYQFLFM